ncbi:MAG: extracellular solute-binding protein [Anaerolineaceae bacterium]|jgi:multiple sugar transport system substrate-binding protein/sn-glycerol 3-phosphate transport system substrate-binding protein|nr:extracellular solute-binding protein [Anaerolineaceae bacterium]
MKKISFLLTFLMVLALVLSACAPAATEEPMAPEEPVEEPVAPVEEPVEEPAEPVEESTEETVVEQPLAGTVVEFWHVYSDAPGEGLQTLVDGFNATNEYGITVEALNQGNYGDVEDKFNAGIQSGDLPDVVMAYTNSLADWYSVDSILDLNPYVDDAMYGLTADQLDDLYPHLKGAGSTPDGAWIAYPMTQSANVLVYNFTWAEELGFANPPANSAELKELVCAAAAENAAKGGDFAGTGGLVYYPNTTNWLHFLYAFGGDELNDAGDAYDFTSQAAVDASMYILDLKKEGCVWQTESYPNPEQAMRKAIITMSSTAGAPYYAAAFEDAGNTTDEWGWIAAPGPDGTMAVDAFQQMLGIVPSTEDEQMASWLFVKWLTSPEIQARWVQISGYYGTQYTTEELLADYATENPVWASGVALAAIGPSEPQTFPAWSSVRRSIGDAAAELWNATDQAQVEAILATLTETANDLVAELD